MAGSTPLTPSAQHGDVGPDGDLVGYVEEFTRSGLERFTAAADVDLAEHLRRVATIVAQRKGNQ